MQMFTVLEEEDTRVWCKTKNFLILYLFHHGSFIHPKFTCMIILQGCLVASSAPLALVPNLSARCPRNALSCLTSPHLSSALALPSFGFYR